MSGDQPLPRSDLLMNAPRDSGGPAAGSRFGIISS